MIKTLAVPAQRRRYLSLEALESTNLRSYLRKMMFLNDEDFLDLSVLRYRDRFVV